MHIFVSFLPILLFITLYVGGGVYFSVTGVQDAFYQLSPAVTIIPALILGWVLHKDTTLKRMHDFLDGVRHRDIITMCMIFLLAGAFSVVTQNIGSLDSTVNLALSLIPSKFLLIGLFITTAFIATAIGTSMGTIATIAPLAVGLSNQGAFPIIIGIATVVAGAMFGDNLSFVSDTTIAAVMSQEADFKLKMKINSVIAFIAALITITVLFFSHNCTAEVYYNDYSFILVSPYVLLILLPMLGFNIFIVLITVLIFSGLLGCCLNNEYSILVFSNDIAKGFKSMHEIMVLSMLIGGLSGLANKGSKDLTTYLVHLVSKRGSKTIAQLLIAAIVSVFDILLANNTVAIIFSGEIARDFAKKYHIPPHYSAAWLDIFSCVFQGIIPYGAQILLAATIAGVSPLEITPHVYYCYILGIVSIIYILCNKNITIS